MRLAVYALCDFMNAAYVICNKCSAVAEMGDHLATIDMDRKLEGCAPLEEGELGSHLTVSPGPRPPSLTSGILIHSAVWPEYTDVSDSTGQCRQDRTG